MDSMDNVRERFAAVEQRTEPLKHQTQALEAHIRTVKRRLHRWYSPWYVAVVALGLALACPFAVQTKTFHGRLADAVVRNPTVRIQQRHNAPQKGLSQESASSGKLWRRAMNFQRVAPHPSSP
jgi:hypothetical protein